MPRRVCRPMFSTTDAEPAPRAGGAGQARVLPLSAMLDDVRRGIWAEIYSSSPRADAFRRELQSDFLATIDGKLESSGCHNRDRPPPPQFGPPAPVLSDDAKSHLRGELATLRADIQRAIPRTTDRSTKLHLLGAVHRIDEILDPNK